MHHHHDPPHLNHLVGAAIFGAVVKTLQTDKITYFIIIYIIIIMILLILITL